MAIRLLDFLFSRQTNRGENWCPLIGHAKKSLGIRRWNKLWGCWGNVVATQGCRETGCSSKEGANYVGYVVSHPRERERVGRFRPTRNYRPFKLDLSLRRCFPPNPNVDETETRRVRLVSRKNYFRSLFFLE